MWKFQILMDMELGDRWTLIQYGLSLSSGDIH